MNQIAETSLYDLYDQKMTILFLFPMVFHTNAGPFLENIHIVYSATRNIHIVYSAAVILLRNIFVRKKIFGKN